MTLWIWSPVKCEVLTLLSSGLHEQTADNGTFALPSARMKLNASISQVQSSASLLKYNSINTKVQSFFIDCKDEFKKALSQSILFHEGIQLWGECLPFLYPTQGDLKDLFDHFIKFCLSCYSCIGSGSQSMNI